MSDTAFAIDDDVRHHLSGWQRELLAVRRLADNTLEAYGRDLLQFLAFLSGHVGGAVSLATLRDLRAADIRAFMARRRGEEIGSRTLSRSLSALRSFFAHLEREGAVATSAFDA